jgi:hypothetical protein
MNILWLKSNPDVKVIFAGQIWDVFSYGYILGEGYYWICNATGNYLVPAIVLEA